MCTFYAFHTGGSERLVRELFHDAEAELAACNGDATRSALHVIVIDEIDAVFRKRSSAEDSGEATRCIYAYFYLFLFIKLTLSTEYIEIQIHP